MPDRFLSYHNAHASLFEYYHSPEREDGPGRTVYTDPRLEVAGAELFDRYQKLGERIAADKQGWEAELDGIGRPSIMVDHQDNAQIGASLLGSRHWKCVWFDPMVAVFVHDSYASVVAGHTVDFAARHFRPEPATEPHGFAALLASAKGVRNYLNFSMTRGSVQPPLIWLAQDYARRLIDTAPDSAEGWKIIGQIESLRSVPQPGPRFRMPFDPVFDLSLVRATYAFRRALELAPHDFLSIMGLEKMYEARLMNEAALPLLDRLVALQPINQLQRNQQSLAESERVQMRQALVRPLRHRRPGRTSPSSISSSTTNFPRDRPARPPKPSSAPTRRRKRPGRSSTRSPRCDFIWANPRKRERSGKRRHRFPGRPFARLAWPRRFWPKAGSTRPAMRSSRHCRPTRALRGPLRPGRARTGRRPRQRRLRARPRRDRIGPLRRRPIGRSGDRVRREPVREKGDQPVSPLVRFPRGLRTRRLLPKNTSLRRGDSQGGRVCHDQPP